MKFVKRFENFGGSIFLFTLFNAVSKALNFLFFALAAFFLSLEEYGRLELLVTYSGIFLVLFSFGFEGYLAREWYEKDKREAENEALKILNFSVLISSLLLAFLMLLINFSSFNNLNDIFLVIIGGAFLGLNAISLVILRLSERRILFIFIQFLQPIIYLSSLTFYYLTNDLPESYMGFLKIYSLSSILLFFTSYLIVRLKIKPSEYKIPWKKFIRYSSGILFNSLLTFLFLQLGRFYIDQNLSEENLGIASLVLRVNGLQFIFAMGLFYGLFPILFKDLAKSSNSLPSSFLFGILFNLSSSIFFYILTILYCAILLGDKFGFEIYFFAFFQVLGIGVYNVLNFVSFSIIKNRVPYFFTVCILVGLFLQGFLLFLFEPTSLISVSLFFLLGVLTIIACVGVSNIVINRFQGEKYE